MKSKILPRNSRCQDKIQDIQEFKIFLRSWQDIQDVECWVDAYTDKSAQISEKRPSTRRLVNFRADFRIFLNSLKGVQ